MKKQRLIYIMGAARSGTTLLDIILGNAEGIESCGELNRIPNRQGIPPSCKKDSEKFKFWEKVMLELNRSDVEWREQEEIHKSFEYHTGFMRCMWGFGAKRSFGKYADFQSELFQILFNTVCEETHTLVDSSKYPGRAFILTKFLAYDMHFIYIKRDPISVVRSFSKKGIEQPGKNWWAANIYYFIINLLCQLTVFRLKQKHPVVEIKYEEMVNKPVKSLRNIERALDVDLTLAINKIANGTPLKVGKLFDGNRTRQMQELRIQSSKKTRINSLFDFFTRTLNIWLY